MAVLERVCGEGCVLCSGESCHASTAGELLGESGGGRECVCGLGIY